MKLGIKAGFHNDWKRDICATHPNFCEIWFEATKMNQYDDLTRGIKKLGGRLNPNIGTIFTLIYDSQSLIYLGQYSQYCPSR